MPIGFPAVPDPRVDLQGVLDARGMQGIVRNIRERLQAAESLVLTVQKQVNQTTFSVGNLQSINRALAQLAARVTALEALSRGSLTVTLVAGASIALDDPVVMISDTECAPVDVGNPERIYAVVGIATNAATPGSTVVVQVAGAYDLSSGSFEAGHALYCDVAGLTESPSYGIVAIPVGVATGSQSMWIQPGYPRLQVPSTYDLSEQYLPITYGLFQALLPVALAPTAEVSFTPVDGVLDGFFMRADAAPRLSTTLVTENADDFSLSTQSDLGGTTNRGDITFTTGENDTFAGSQLALTGANDSGPGLIDVAAGGRLSLAARGGENTLLLGDDASNEVILSAAGNITVSTAQGGLGISATSTSQIDFPGDIVISFADFGSVGDAQAAAFAMRVQTTDATPTELEVTPGNFIVLVDDSSYIFDCQIVARNTGSDTQTAAFSLTGVIRRGAGVGTTTVVGTPVLTVLAQDAGAVTWTCSFTADTTNGRPNIAVTGEAAKTINWVANTRMTKVSG